MAKRLNPIFRVLTLLCIGCMAIAAIVIGTEPVSRYRELSAGTLLYYTVSLVVGVGLLVYGVIALRSRRMVTIGGLLAGIVLGINQIIGLRFSTILCFTPS